MNVFAVWNASDCWNVVSLDPAAAAAAAAATLYTAPKSHSCCLEIWTVDSVVQG